MLKKKIKLHARVTKEIEITEEQAEKLVNYLCGCDENSDIEDIIKMFGDGVDAGSYEEGYIPAEWVSSDLKAQLHGDLLDYYKQNNSRFDDIEL